MLGVFNQGAPLLCPVFLTFAPDNDQICLFFVCLRSLFSYGLLAHLSAALYESRREAAHLVGPCAGHTLSSSPPWR